MRFWRAALGVGAVTAVVLVLASAAAANHNLIQHVSTGPTDPNAGENVITSRISSSGNAVVFNTGQQLVPADTDSSQDTYVRHEGVTELVSAGEINGNGAFNTAFDGLSSDGSRIWFQTREQLVSEDTDTFTDIYERNQGHTYQVSTGPMNANQASNSIFQTASPDGTRVYFSTVEPLTPDDPDLCFDIYERSGGVTTLISTGKLGCSFPGNISAVGYADTGSGPALVVRTLYQMDPSDTDSDIDVYELVGGQAKLLSQGPGTSGTSSVAEAVHFSPQANAALIWSRQRLTADDLDDNDDLYLSKHDALTRVSKGPVGGNGSQDLYGGSSPSNNGLSADGQHAFFSTAEQLTLGDADTAIDLYEYDASDGTTRLIGDGGFFNGTSGDGSHVVFGTASSLDPGDTDSAFDFYEDEAGVVMQVSTGNAAASNLFGGISLDGQRVFFLTTDPHTGTDTNGAADLYERYNGTLYLLSRDSAGMAGGASTVGMFGNPDAGMASDGKNIAFLSLAQLLPSDTDSNVDVYLATRTPDAYARPKAATPINVPFVPAYRECMSPNRAHAAPLSFDSCNPPLQASDYLTVGTPDANMQPAKSIGNLRLVVQLGDPTTPGNEADAFYEISVSDVRNKSDLTDHTGALKLDAALQITDRNNPDPGGGSPNATGSQTSFPVVVPCASTPDTTVGSTCSVTTTANTIAPGAVVEGKRAIWEMGQVRVFDGGADGDPGTADGDGVFLVQGVFVP